MIWKSQWVQIAQDENVHEETYMSLEALYKDILSLS